MNQLELQRKLIAAARAHPPSDDVPYAFEKRVMARLRHSAARDPWAVWGQALWRAAVSCIAVTLLLGAWSWLAPDGSGSDLSQALENTVFAAADQQSQSSAELVW